LATQCEKECVKYYKWPTLTTKTGHNIPELSGKFPFRVCKRKLFNYAEKSGVNSCRKLHLLYSRIKWGKEATALCQRYMESLFGKLQLFKCPFYLYSTLTEFTELLLSTLFCFSYRKAWRTSSETKKLVHGNTIKEDYDFSNCSIGIYSALYLSFASSGGYILS